MDKFSYLILVEVPAVGPITDLAAALQEAFDDGADGFFEIVATHQPTYMVTFLRTTAGDDMDYLRNHMFNGGPSLKTAAMRQLGLELKPSVGDLAIPVVNTLLAGDAHIIDFNGVLADDVLSGEASDA